MLEEQRGARVAGASEQGGEREEVRVGRLGASGAGLVGHREGRGGVGPDSGAHRHPLAATGRVDCRGLGQEPGNH